MHRALVCVYLALALPAVAGEPTPEHAAAAINKAGRQRMLTQRVVKLHVQIALDVAPSQARTLLDASLALLASQAAELAPAAASGPPREALASMRATLPDLQALALARPDRARAPDLEAAAESVLSSADALTAALEPRARLGWLVNLSGRQRMVSQRLAKLYMLRAWAAPLPSTAEQSAAAQAEFASALSRLLRADENTPEIDRELYAIAVQWEWFKAALDLQDMGSYALVVADASESMLRSLERVVSLYEQVAAH